MSSDNGSTHNRSAHSRGSHTGSTHSKSPRPIMKEEPEEEERFSPESYLRNLALRQSQRLRVRRKWRERKTNRKGQQSFLSLAERIVIAKLDPENFSMQTTRSQEVQKAVLETPRPSLSDLIRQYRRIEALEQSIGQSMIDKVKDTQDHMKRVEDHLQQPILMQGEQDNTFLNQPASGSPKRERSTDEHVEQREELRKSTQIKDEERNVSQSASALNVSHQDSTNSNTNSEKSVEMPKEEESGQHLGQKQTRGSSNLPKTKDADISPPNEPSPCSLAKFKTTTSQPSLRQDVESPLQTFKSVHASSDDENCTQNDTHVDIELNDSQQYKTNRLEKVTEEDESIDRPSIPNDDPNLHSGLLMPSINAHKNGDSTHNQNHTPDRKQSDQPSKHLLATSLPEIAVEGEHSNGEKTTDPVTPLSTPVIMPSIAAPTNPTAPTIDSRHGENQPENRTKDSAQKQSQRENKFGTEGGDSCSNAKSVLTRIGQCSSTPEADGEDGEVGAPCSEREGATKDFFGKGQECQSNEELKRDQRATIERAAEETAASKSENADIPIISVQATDVIERLENGKTGTHNAGSKGMETDGTVQPYESKESLKGTSESETAYELDKKTHLKAEIAPHSASFIRSAISDDSHKNENCESEQRRDSLSQYQTNARSEKDSYDREKITSSYETSHQNTSRENRDGMNSEADESEQNATRSTKGTSLPPALSQNSNTPSSNRYPSPATSKNRESIPDNNGDKSDNVMIVGSSESINDDAKTRIVTGKADKHHVGLAIVKTPPGESGQCPSYVKPMTGVTEKSPDLTEVDHANDTGQLRSKHSVACFDQKNKPNTWNAQRDKDLVADDEGSFPNEDEQFQNYDKRESVNLRSKRSENSGKIRATKTAKICHFDSDSPFRKITDNHEKVHVRMSENFAHNSDLVAFRGKPKSLDRNSKKQASLDNQRSAGKPQNSQPRYSEPSQQRSSENNPKLRCRRLRPDTNSRRSTAESPLSTARKPNPEARLDQDDSEEDCSNDTDDSEDGDDNRIYDFIGVSRERSYTRPELVSVRRNSVRPRYRLHRDTFDIRQWTTSPRSKLPGPPISAVRRQCFLDTDQLSPTAHHTAQDKRRESQTSTLTLPTLQTTDFVTRRHQPSSLEKSKSSLSYGHVRLPEIPESSNKDGCKDHVTGNDDRHHRIVGLYQELKQFNVYCRGPSTLRVNLSRRTSDLDMRIEWGRLLPEHNNAMMIHYRAKNFLQTKTDSNTSNEILKLPTLKNSLAKRRKKFRRNFSEKFIFLDDDVIPRIELHHNGEGFHPDVSWFVQPGVASEHCDVGFSAGMTRDKKSRAWESLRNRCRPKVHIMRALEMKSFAGEPKLTLRCRGKDPLKLPPL